MTLDQIINATTDAPDVKELTSNQYYRGLNRRFRNRARRLLALGFRYQHVPIGMPGYPSARPDNVGVFARNRFNRIQAIPASLVTYTSSRAFYDELSRTLYH